MSVFGLASPGTLHRHGRFTASEDDDNKMNKKTDYSKSGQGKPVVSEKRLPSLRRYGFYGLLAALLSSLLIGLALFQLNRMQVESVRSNQYQALAQAHLAKLSALLHQFNAVLDRWVQSPELIATLETGDPDAFREKEREFSFLFPFTRRVRLFEPSLEGVTPEKIGTPPLSYAAIELLRRTRESPTPPPPRRICSAARTSTSTLPDASRMTRASWSGCYWRAFLWTCCNPPCNAWAAIAMYA